MGSKITVDGDCSHKIKKHLLLGRKAMTNLDSVLLKSRDITLPTKVYIVKAIVFPVSHVQMWKLNHKEGLASKNWCFWTVVLEKALESPLDCKEIKPVNPKGNQPWIFNGRTDAKAEAPVLWPPDGKEPSHWKRPWCWERLKAKGEEGGRWREGSKLTCGEMTQLVWGILLSRMLTVFRNYYLLFDACKKSYLQASL